MRSGRIEVSDQKKKPFSYSRTVAWGDCDPARMIYTPRVIDYAYAAVEAWYREVVGITWMVSNFQMDTGVPTVRLECDYISAPRPDDVIDMAVRVERVGRASLTLAVDGLGTDGKHYFKARFVGCFVASQAHTSKEIPPEFRERIAAYQAACGDA